MTVTTARYARITRLLHTGLAAAVLLQLLSEQLMRIVKPGEPVPSTFETLSFTVHEFIGFVVLILVGVRFILLMDDKKDGWSSLFPWIEPSGRAALFNEIRNEIPGWLRGKLKSPDEAALLARTVHGLGLLLAFGMGMTGSFLFVSIRPDGSMDAVAKAIKEMHEILGTVMWVYVIGHAVMAFTHQMLGHRVLQDIFSPDRD